MTTRSDSPDVLVVGGGLAGLAAATYAARAGCATTLLERASVPGGRAVTHERAGFRFNLGPHALYNGGAARAVLKQLDVAYDGGIPDASGAFALDEHGTHALPGGPVSLLTTSLFGVGDKIETAKLLAGFRALDPTPWHGVGARAWAERAIRHRGVRRLILALFRLATYAADTERLSAGTAITQLKLALADNVSYLHGGWQTLVDGLRARAGAEGVTLRTTAPVVALDRAAGGAVRGVQLRDGSMVTARTVILALPADAAAKLLPDGPLRRRLDAAIPARAACLDVGLTRLPRARARFALGIDRPIYCSVHSATARLAPPDGAVIHVARYLDDEPRDPHAVERELEAVLDVVQPGWRPLVAERRFLPDMVAASALVTAAEGGLPQRPGPGVAEVTNLFVAGDWVGGEGWLADASLASARAAAALAATRIGRAVEAA